MCAKIESSNLTAEDYGTHLLARSSMRTRSVKWNGRIIPERRVPTSPQYSVHCGAALRPARFAGFSDRGISVAAKFAAARYVVASSF